MERLKVGASLRSNEALSCGSLHKKVESEKQFQLIHMNKEDYRLNLKMKSQFKNFKGSEKIFKRCKKNFKMKRRKTKKRKESKELNSNNFFFK